MIVYWGLCTLFSGISHNLIRKKHRLRLTGLETVARQSGKMRDYEGRFTHTYYAVGRYIGA